MRIKNISLDDEEMPEIILAELTIKELALIHFLVGGLRPDQLNEALGFDYKISSDIFNGACQVFNRFWDDGVNEYASCKSPTVTLSRG